MSRPRADTSLDDPYARLAWSDQHLNRMAGVAGEYMADFDSHEFTNKRETKAIRAYVRIKRHPPYELGLMLGDWLHSLHAALDNLLAQLVHLNGRTPGRVSFPIFDKPGTFNGEGLRRLKNVHPDHITLIEQLQPYPGRDDKRNRALGLVGEFSNLDKHKAIQPATTLVYPDPKHVGFSIDPPDPDLRMRVFFTGAGKPLEDGAEVAKFDFFRPSGRSYVLLSRASMHVDCGFGFGIAFGEKGLGYKSLPTIRRYIGAIVDRFAAEFPEELRPIPLGLAEKSSSTWPGAS